MAVLNIRIAPDNVLNKKAIEVQVVDKAIIKLLDDMQETMLAHEGIGLAAPQIGVLKRLLVMDCSNDTNTNNLYRMINPKVVSQSKELYGHKEGCLSFPGQYVYLDRPKEVEIEFKNEKGEKIKKCFEGLESICVQHEIDHLDGVLFIDYLSKLKKNIIIRKLVKTRKNIGN